MISAPTSPLGLRDVTVVLRTQDHVSTLSACLDSLLEQSIGAERFEVVAVDDGSYDDSAILLSRASAEHPGLLRVGRQPRGQSPAAARNTGMSQARGRYLLFLEGSDRLAPEALERMVQVADKNESDVVLGRLESTGKHSVAASMFRKNLASADLSTSRVYRSLTPEKLFRADLLRRRGLHFPHDVLFGEDQPFTAAAYLAADNISVLADYTCVYKGPGSSSGSPGRPPERVALAARMMELVHASVADESLRDRLLSRHLEVELGKATGALLLEEENPGRREQAMHSASQTLRSFATPGSLALLPRPMAVRFALLWSGRFAEALRMVEYEVDPGTPAPKKVVEEGRVYSALPYFRDPSAQLPDSLFDITDKMTVTQELGKMTWSGAILTLEGYAFFEQLSTRDRATKIVLRERRTGAEEVFSVTARRDEKLVNAKGRARAMGRFSARVNLRQTSNGWPISSGVWDVRLAVSFEGVTREVPVGKVRSAAIDSMSRLPHSLGPAPRNTDHELVVIPVYSSEEHLALEVSERLPLPSTPA